MDIEEIVGKVTKEVMAALGNAGQNAESGAEVAGTIEHSVLNPDMSEQRIVEACKEARECLLANVCVSPYFVSLAADCLRGSGVKVCTVVGFPHGAASTAAKMTEAREAIKNGAEELDVAMNIVAIKSGKNDDAQKDLSEIVNIAKGRAAVKAIYEQGLYTEEEKLTALHIARACGVDYIKISNALTGKKATSEDVRFVRSIIGENIGIKIDGGIDNAGKIKELMQAGANRFGCSKSVKIVKGE